MYQRSIEWKKGGKKNKIKGSAHSSSKLPTTLCYFIFIPIIMMSFVFTHSQRNEGADKIAKPNKQTKAKNWILKPKCRFQMYGNGCKY